MKPLYGPEHRQFQSERGMIARADRLAEMMHTEFDDRELEFIERVRMIFLATVDAEGRPTVSYKGGAPGFVRVTGRSNLRFPSYGGNGMYLTLGNIATKSQVGLLFIDFETPRRLRVQGIASVVDTTDALAEYPGAEYVVSVDVTHIFINCGRYVHRSEGAVLSPHIPDADGTQPFPNWKRLEIFRDTLTPEEAIEVERAGGPVTIEQLLEK